MAQAHRHTGSLQLQRLAGLCRLCGVRGDRRPGLLRGALRYFFYAALAFNVILAGCGRRVRFRRASRDRRGLGGPGDQRSAAVAVLAVLPRLPARRRRPDQPLLQASHPVPGVDGRVPAEPRTTATSPGRRWCGCPGRLVRAAGRQRRHPPPAGLLNSETAMADSGSRAAGDAPRPPANRRAQVARCHKTGRMSPAQPGRAGWPGRGEGKERDQDAN